jgi:hypothetical protein
MPEQRMETSRWQCDPLWLAGQIVQDKHVTVRTVQLPRCDLQVVVAPTPGHAVTQRGDLAPPADQHPVPVEQRRGIVLLRFDRHVRTVTRRPAFPRRFARAMAGAVPPHRLAQVRIGLLATHADFFTVIDERMARQGQQHCGGHAHVVRIAAQLAHYAFLVVVGQEWRIIETAVRGGAICGICACQRGADVKVAFL